MKTAKIHGPPKFVGPWSGLVRDFQILFSLGPVLKIRFLDFLGYGTVLTGFGPPGFGPWIPKKCNKLNLSL